MTATVHNTAIIPAPRTAQVIHRVATVDTVGSALEIQPNVFPGAHYRFTAEGSAVYMLFGESAAEIGAIAVDAVAGPTRPSVFIPQNDYLDLYVDARNRFFRHVSADANGFLWVVKASL